MAVTLADVASTETEPLRKGIIMNLIRDSNLLARIPFDNVDSLQNISVRARTLPSGAWRRINEGYTADEGAFEQVQEAVYGFGGEIEFDRVFDMTSNYIIKPRVAQTQLKLKALALTFNDFYINGDHAVDPDSLVGLKKRVTQLPARQSVDLAVATSALDVTASAANARAFIDGLEKAHYRTNDGNVAMILVNEGLVWGIGRALRFLQTAGNFLDVTTDQFDRKIPTYKGAPIIDVGLKKDQSTEIITATEDPGDGGNDATSMYFVSHDSMQGIRGMQLNSMDVYDPLDGGERESKPTKLLRIDWWVGLHMPGSYGLARLSGIMDPDSWT